MKQVLKLTTFLCLSTMLGAACGDDDAVQVGDAQAGTGGANDGSSGSGGSIAGSSGSGDGGCTPGELRTCACPNSGSGSETCQANGSFGACACSPTNGGDSSDGPPVNTGAFAKCTSPSGCSGGLSCFRSGTGAVPSAQTPGYCTVLGCQDGGATCPQPSTGTIQTNCSTLADVCILQCGAPDAGDAGTCPVGMECQTVPTVGRRCQYPAQLAQRYGECGAGVQCADGLQCYMPLAQCAEACGDGGTTCTPPASGTAKPVCQPAGPGGGVCVLECIENTDCPLGMTCRPQGGAGGAAAQRCSF